MAKVNPPSYLKLPKKIREDAEVFEYFDQMQFIVWQMWKRTGGGDDFILDLQSETTYNTGSSAQSLEAIDSLSQIEDLIPTIDRKLFYTTIKGVNYTAIAGDFVEARNGSIITLDANADKDDEIIIANGDGTKITVSGDIKYTSTTDKMFIRNQGTSLHFQMFVDGTTKYWRIR